MNYSDYHKRLSIIEAAFNDAELNNHKVVFKSVTDAERTFEGIGFYLKNICDALRVLSLSNHLLLSAANSISYLVHLMRNHAGSFSFGLVPVCEWEDLVADDPETELNWQAEMTVYERMTPEAFLGAAVCRIAIDTFSPSDVSDWCSQQAAHLAKYCIANDIDILEVIKAL